MASDKDTDEESDTEESESEESESEESKSDESKSDESEDSQASYQIKFIFSFYVSEGLRQMFCVFLLVSNFLFINCGVVFIVLCWYVKFSLEKQITFLQDYYQLKSVPTILLVTGVAMLLTSFLGVKAAIGGRSVEDDASEAKSAAFYFLVFLVAAGIMVFLILIAACTCFHEIRILRAALGKGIKDGMQRYIKNADVKIEMDLLQIDYGCCGVDGFKDWYQVAWVSMKYLDRYDPLISQSLKGEKYYGKDVPFSCCSMDMIRPCVDTRIEDVTYHSMYNYPSDLTLNNVGCRKVLTSYLGHTIFLGIGLFAFFCFLIWIAIAVITRYLQTSLTQISLGEHPVGWLIPYEKKNTKGTKGKKSFDIDNDSQEEDSD